ncbi:PaaX family transcriptional regulator C-terminal domain-containing protein [Kineosporia sp. NBRC 101731]|uniref:PaaX family transcriptional regulator n=1 Tax=Kineosporia sp. NBRC 101731 TaxID=3032199 RepID=UPI0024A46F7E|nr:PaaX family transcriptional regulator C-terminal domain-containing protein [Kineosporia sp. NBRC 101731]GLY29729.1 phenylacetic acid degradation operon negative regulatory protein [Kineosporia sp. NBRC 101731]
MTSVADLKPRSLILDLFGEYLRFTSTGTRLSHLTTLLETFEVAPATVRVTISRLRREGWFVNERSGRETRYQLTDGMRRLLEEGRQRIFAPPPTTWPGEWTMVTYQLTEAERHERDQLKKDLAWHGFGPLSTSTWLAPGDRRPIARELLQNVGAERAEILRCLSDGLDHDRSLAARCWDLTSLALEYADFNARHEPLIRRASGLKGSQALVARTLLISHYRHFPFRDPQLPPPLKPDGWPGDDAYQIFRTAHRALGPAARDFVSEVVGEQVTDAEAAFEQVPASRP